MTDKQRQKKLRRAVDDLTQKVTDWMQTLDLDTAGPQAVRQLCGTLKDLRELCRELEEPEKRGCTVIIEGGEERWNS